MSAAYSVLAGSVIFCTSILSISVFWALGIRSGPVRHQMDGLYVDM